MLTMTDDATQRPAAAPARPADRATDRATDRASDRASDRPLDRRGHAPGTAPAQATGGQTSAPGTTAFAARVEELLADCRRHKLPMAVLSVAIDSVGRNGEHDAYDLESGVALEFGHRLRGRVRGSDHVLWVGDREYGVALIDAGADGARAVHRRLLDALGGTYRLGDQLATVRLSAGFAVYPADGSHGAALVATAIASRLRG